VLKILRFVTCCYVLFIISGCANQNRLPDFDQTEFPQYIHLSDVPFFPQEPLLCGPAALATVIHFYDQKTTPGLLTERLWTPEVEGTFGIDMVSATRTKNLLAIDAPANLEELLLLTSQGWPSIHLLNLGFKKLPQWHYAVLVGYDLNSQEVLLRSGRVRVRKMSFKHFLRAKDLADNWSLVPATLESIPRLDNWRPVYKELLNVAEVKPSLKHQLFSAGNNVYPDQWQFVFAYANTMFELNQFSKSTHAYESAIKLSPNSASVWNNLAYSQAEQGCLDLAKETIQCAGNLSPDDENISQSITEILMMKSVSFPLVCQSELVCPVPLDH